MSSPRKQSMNESLDLAEGIGFKKKGGGFGFIAGCGALGIEERRRSMAD